MGLTPHRRAGSPREQSPPKKSLPREMMTTTLNAPPPSPDQPQHTYRTLCALRLFLEAVELDYRIREPLVSNHARKQIQSMRSAIQAHIANLTVAADHESYLFELDMKFTAEKGGEA